MAASFPDLLEAWESSCDAGTHNALLVHGGSPKI